MNLNFSFTVVKRAAQTTESPGIRFRIAVCKVYNVNQVCEARFTKLLDDRKVRFENVDQQTLEPFLRLFNRRLITTSSSAFIGHFPEATSLSTFSEYQIVAILLVAHWPTGIVPHPNWTPGPSTEPSNSMWSASEPPQLPDQSASSAYDALANLIKRR